MSKRFAVFGGPDQQLSRMGECSESDFELQARFEDEVVIERKAADKEQMSDLFGITLEQYQARVF